MSNAEPRFRITPWPDTPLAVGRVMGLDHRLDGDRIVVTLGRPDVELPEEFVIRELLEQPFDDPNVVVDFLNEFGTVKLHEIVRTLEWDVTSELPKSIPADSWRRYAYVLGLIQHEARRWVATQEGRPARLRLTTRLDREQFANVLNMGLRQYAVRLEVGRLGQPFPDLYAALCLQLFNLVVEGLPTRRCVNETCGRSFVRQRDRAVHGQYRTEGVIYCSKQCAKAQNQRVYRRKQRKGNR